ncbi:hypothetical protein EV121DRAFT_192955 [Schizophyllum commune]
MTRQSQRTTKEGVAFTDVPLDGSLSISAAVDFHLEHNPDATCFSCAEPDGTVHEITYRDFGRAVHRVAHALRPGKEGVDGAVVAIIALSDTVVYHAVTTGLIRAGLVPFPISPRLAAPAVASLLRTSSCQRLVTTQQTLHTLISDLKAELGEDYGLIIDEMPALSDVYPRFAAESPLRDAEKAEHEEFEPYPRLPVKPDDLLFYIHSSGSTGYPKAVGQTHANVQGWTRLATITDIHRFEPRPCFASHILPPFHGLAFWAHVLVPLFGGAEVALFAPTVKTHTEVPTPPTPEAHLAAAHASGSTAIVTVPAYVHQWADIPAALEYLKSLQVLIYCGGPLSDALGDNLSASGVKLRSILGATEFGIPSHLMPTHEEDWTEWCWVELDANASLNWEKQDDGTEELIISAEGDHWHKPAVLNMPGRRAYATNDLYLPHPTKPHLRKVVGRKDDVIVHSTGEKTVPIPIEGLILTSPLVAAAVMFGRGKDEAGILIEPSAGHRIDVKDDVQVAAFRNAIWPIVEAANRAAPAYSRIFKELILVAHPDRPLPRTDKGTVIRKLALKVYEEEIENIYKALESAEHGEVLDGTPPSSWETATIKDWITQHIRDITGRNVDPAADLFEQGFDSLNSTILRRRIVSAMRSDPSLATTATKIRQNVVYEHPSVEKLAMLVSNLAKGDMGMTDSHATSAKEAIIAMAAKHSEGLPGYVDSSTLPKYVVADAAKAPTLPAIVLMTGTTGNLGADILAQLLQNQRVTRVYTIDRAGSGPAAYRQRSRFEDKGLDVGLLESAKLVTLEGDVSAENLGQSDAVYAEMLNTINMIFHVAWRLDFNLGINAFERSVRSTRALVDFARKSSNVSNLRFIFTNSIGSAWSWDSATQGPVPEQLVEDSGVAVGGGGYGQAKYAAERVLAASGIPFCSVRVGQISGDAPRGSWATTDWFPILVKTSLALSALPSDEQEVNWVSSNSVAGTLIDAAFFEDGLAPSHNIVHPRPVNWARMIEDVQHSLKKQLGRDVPIIPFQEWLEKLEATAARTDVDVQEVPGVKLLDFFRGMSSGRGLGDFATDKMTAVSKTLRVLQSLGQKDADAWVRYWCEKQMLA